MIRETASVTLENDFESEPLNKDAKDYLSQYAVLDFAHQIRLKNYDVLDIAAPYLHGLHATGTALISSKALYKSSVDTFINYFKIGTDKIDKLHLDGFDRGVLVEIFEQFLSKSVEFHNPVEDLLNGSKTLRLISIDKSASENLDSELSYYLLEAFRYVEFNIVKSLIRSFAKDLQVRREDDDRISRRAVMALYNKPYE